MPWWTPLLRAQPPCPAEDWWAWHCAVEADHPLARAALAAARADHLAAAFTSGYQAAIESLLGETRPSALAVTEQGGGHPRAIATTLVDGRLRGTKTFVTHGPDAEAVWVVARVGEAEGRPALKVARVVADAPGIRWSPGPTPPFVPEVAHGILSLHDTPVERVLDGDGYLAVVKPFRTVEDLHVLAAAMGFALGEAARQGCEPAWREDALALLLALEPLAAADPGDPAVHLPLAALFRQAGALLDAAPWSDPPRWQRDRTLLDVARGIRERRTRRAREAVA